MADERINIKIEVAQRPFELVVPREAEIYYREAEKKINDTLAEFAKRWKYTDYQDLLSKVLIDFVVKWIENEERLNEFDEELIPKMENLKALTDAIDID